MYKMFIISAETYVKNCVYNMIDKEKMLWLRNKDIEEKSGVKNFYDFIDNEIKAVLRLKIRQIKKLENVKGMDQN